MSGMATTKQPTAVGTNAALDALSEWVDERMAPITGEILAELSSGIVSGTTTQGFRFHFLSESQYPVDKI